MDQQQSNDPGGTSDHLRHEAEEVVGQTQHDVEQVVRHAGEEAGSVVDTARREVRDVVDEAASAIRQEADQRTRQAGNALHDLGRDLHEMAEGQQSRSTASEYVDAIANTVDRLADQLEEGGSEGMLTAIRSTASRRPGAFVSGSALAGFVVGRMIRNGDRPDPGSPDRDDRPEEIDLRTDSRSLSSQRSEYGEPRRSMPEPVREYASSGSGRPGTRPIPPPPPPPPATDPRERF